MSHVTHRMSHVTYRWVTSHASSRAFMPWMCDSNGRVMSHENASFQALSIWMRHVMSHVPEQWVMSLRNESEMSHVTQKWVTSHKNKSCHVGMSHVRTESLSHFTQEWVTLHINESCHIKTSHVTWKWVMSELSHWVMPRVLPGPDACKR